MNTVAVSKFQKFVSANLTPHVFTAPESVERPSDEVAKLIRETIPNDGQEHVFVVAADAHCKPLAVGIVSTGTVDMCLLSPRDIFAWALTIPCARFVAVAHNHPSGDVTPSGLDGKGTAVVASAGKVLGLDLLWSLVVTHDSDKWAEVPLPKGKQPQKQGDDAEPKRPEPEDEDEPGDEDDSPDEGESEDSQPEPKRPEPEDEDEPGDESEDDGSPEDDPEPPEEPEEPSEDEAEPEESGIEPEEQGEPDQPGGNPDTADSEVTVDDLRASVRKAFGLK